MLIINLHAQEKNARYMHHIDSEKKTLQAQL